jgi:hypothetical protein
MKLRRSSQALSSNVAGERTVAMLMAMRTCECDSGVVAMIRCFDDSVPQRPQVAQIIA